VKQQLILCVLLQLTLLPRCSAGGSPSCFAGRPFYHFAPPQNWTNDPNGLILFQHQYHLFYQHNPFANEWGHMSWGHAVSRDLLHWQHLPLAIAEDSVMIFSGSAVYDSLNTSGLGGDEGALVAIYTGHKSGRQAQYLAFSIDGGMTWEKYRGNPVLDRELTDFRDPKVFWYEPQHQWIMVVALPTQHQVAFYHSPNLINWDFLSTFGPEGNTGGLWECPDLFEMPIAGRDDHRWVLIVSSAGPHQGQNGNQYFVGQFDGTTFVNDHSAELALYLDYGRDFYAAQTFNNISIDRRILVAWMSNWNYAGATPEQGFRGRMTMPRLLRLYPDDRGLRLRHEPMMDLSSFPPLIALDGASAEEINAQLSLLPAETAYSLEVDAAASLNLSDGAHSPFFSYRNNEQNLIFNRSNDASCFSHRDYAAADTLHLEDVFTGKFTLFFDSNSVEIFCDDGVCVLSYLLFPGISLNNLKMSGKSLRNVTIRSLHRP